jgi:uncharacterized repeat protein (TIGR01451 family)
LLLGAIASVALILTLSPLPARAEGTVIYVDASAGGAVSGLDWTNAYTNVQDALADASSGDEIWVAEGVYYPDQGTEQIDNAVTSTFALKPGVTLYGGFPSGGSAFDARDWETYVTVLSGDLEGNDTTDAHGVVTDTDNVAGANAYNVVTAQDLTATTLLDGFSVTGGYADGSACPGSRCGGGMLNVRSPSALQHVTFSGNYSYLTGGGMIDWGADGAALTDVTFVANYSPSGGGGLAVVSSTARLTGVVFRDNTAGPGGGMHSGSSSPVLTNSTFISNMSSAGGGFYNGPSMFTSDPAGNPRLINVTFVDNIAETGGGLYTIGVSTPTLVNTIVWGNTSFYEDSAYQIYNVMSSTLVLSHTLVQSGTGHIVNQMGAITIFGPHTLTDNPRFVSPATGDYRLRGDSPAIDAGDSSAIAAMTDLDGIPRILGAAVDLGAYEFHGPILTLRKLVTPTGTVLYPDTVTYTLDLSNAGLLSDTVLLTDTLPPSITFGGWVSRPTGTIRSGDAITWTGILTGGERITAILTATHTGDYGDTVTNTAYFSGTLEQGSEDAVFSVAPNQLPVAQAGPDQQTGAGMPVTLDGSASFDPEGHPLAYHWSQIAGPAVGFTPTLSTIAFTAPGGTYVMTFTLTVTDTGGLIDTDSVVIDVEDHRLYLPLVARDDP